MLFNSYIFILAFFPLFAAGYFLFGKMRDRRFALTFIIVMSLVFYGYNNVRHVPLILSSIAVNYLISRLLSREAWRNREHLRRALLAGGILFNTALIFYYKYYDFFFTNVNALFHTHVPMKGLLLPLGISFFTFQQISFLADSYRMTTAGYSIFEYAAFVTFFPQLVAGPIVLHSELIPQFRDPEKRKPDADRIADGICRFSAGLFKKVLIADTFAGAVAWGFANTESASPADLILVMLAYTFQIYFDFSGYCDMAAGIAETVNISLPINFDSPYRGAADGTPAGITSFDEYGAWIRFYPGQFGSRYVLKNRRKFKKPASVSHLTDDEAEAVREKIKQNVTSLCKEHPETTFCYFITPYSAAFWGREYQKGRLEKRIETERIVLEEMLPVENLEVYSFSCMTDITGDLDNNKDPRHFGEWINTRILEMMREGTGRLTGDNYEAYLKEEEELYRTFDYQALF